MTKLWLLAWLPFVASAAGYAVAATPEETEIRADCRMEGEAGGLTGTDLEAFVEECVADLMSVRLSNPQE